MLEAPSPFSRLARSEETSHVQLRAALLCEGSQIAQILKRAQPGQRVINEVASLAIDAGETRELPPEQVEAPEAEAPRHELEQ